MTTIKYITGAGAITAIVAILTVAILLTDRNEISNEGGSPSLVKDGNLTSGSPGKESVVREELASLTTHVEALQQQFASLRQVESREGGDPSDLYEDIRSLKEELSALAGRTDVERSNPLDYRDTADSAPYIPDDAKLAYEAQQQHDLAESEFQLQEVDSQWAIATADQVYDRLTTDQDSMFPGEDADLTSLADTLECRGRTCRVEIPSTDGEPMDAVQLQLLASTADLFSSGTVHQTDSGSVILYMHANSQ